MRALVVLVCAAGCLATPPLPSDDPDADPLAPDADPLAPDADPFAPDAAPDADLAAPDGASDLVYEITWTKISGSCPGPDVSPSRFRVTPEILFRFEDDCGGGQSPRQAQWEDDTLVLSVGHTLYDCDQETMENLPPFSIGFDPARESFVDVVFIDIDRTTIEGSYVCTISYKMEQVP